MKVSRQGWLIDGSHSFTVGFAPGPWAKGRPKPLRKIGVGAIAKETDHMRHGSPTPTTAIPGAAANHQDRAVHQDVCHALTLS